MEVGQDEFKEYAYILPGSQGVGGGRTVVRVAESDIDRLIEEEDVGVLGPAKLVAHRKGGQGGVRGGVLRY